MIGKPYFGFSEKKKQQWLDLLEQLEMECITGRYIIANISSKAVSVMKKVREAFEKGDKDSMYDTLTNFIHEIYMFNHEDAQWSIVSGLAVQILDPLSEMKEKEPWYPLDRWKLGGGRRKKSSARKSKRSRKSRTRARKSKTKAKRKTKH